MFNQTFEMSGNKVFLDTNILLYLLSGDETIAELLNGKQFYISFITQLELLGYTKLDKKQANIINDLLSHCVIIAMMKSNQGLFS